MRRKSFIMQKSLLRVFLLLFLLCTALCGCTNLPQQTTTVPPVTTVPVTTVPPTEPPTTAAPTEPVPVNTESMDFLKLLYAQEHTVTSADYTLVDVIVVEDSIYKIVWTADVDEDIVKIIPNDNGTVTVDINEFCAEDTDYALTASIATAEGYRLTHSWSHTIPKGKDMVTIVEEAYALRKGEKLPYPATLTGTVISIEKEWSDDYQNITVTIAVAGCERRPIRCYCLKGEDAKNLQKGDVITVTGILQNYSSRIEFDSGCTLKSIKNNIEEKTNEN